MCWILSGQTEKIPVLHIETGHIWQYSHQLVISCFSHFEFQNLIPQNINFAFSNITKPNCQGSTPFQADWTSSNTVHAYQLGTDLESPLSCPTFDVSVVVLFSQVTAKLSFCAFFIIPTSYRSAWRYDRFRWIIASAVEAALEWSIKYDR